MSSETIHIAGRYNKYLRDLSQSPWIDKNDVRVKDSVQEMIEDGLKKYLAFDKSVFASSGREDVDVRMLGKGRPFAFKILNPNNVELYNQGTLAQVSDFVNSKYSGKVRIRDLQIVSKADVAKYLKDGQESKRKGYRALCCCTRALTSKDIDKINNSTDLCIEQKTPIRVLHRRTLATRRRTIYNLKVEPVTIGEFDSARKENLENMLVLTMVTEAGTYIKEFVHGDFGRTKPNLSSLLGDCDTDLMELDVMEVHLDWPPIIEENSINSTTILINQEDHMETSDEALAELYKKGYQLMQKALDSPRGDERQDLFIQSRRLLERSQRIVESLALYSENETVDDISTVNLKYLLIPAYLAKISISSEMESRRLEAFMRTEALVRQFLQRVSSYGLGNQRVEHVLRSIDDGSPSPLSQPSAAPKSLEEQMRSRAEKIEKLNETRRLEEQLAELERRVESDQNVDDEVARNYFTQLLQRWILEAVEIYEGIVQPGLFFERGSSGGRVDRKTPPRSLTEKAPASFTIVRDQLQKKAFGVGYPSLPTYSVDEFITKKMRDGELAFQTQKEIYANSLQRYAEQPDLRREQEEQSDEEHDAKEDRDDVEEIAKKRAWDEFKDETPRGSGNRHNMG